MSPYQTGEPMTFLDCPKSIIGRVIGRGGETINELQMRSGARIQIDQKVPEGAPCKVQISGNPQVTELAIKLVTDIMNGGSTGGMGGGMMGMMRAQQGYPQAGYGGYPQAAAYGGYPQAAYGGYPQAAYGGYPQAMQAMPGYGGYAQPAASAWSEHDDGQGNKYWYNASTGQSQWERPADA